MAFFLAILSWGIRYNCNRIIPAVGIIGNKGMLFGKGLKPRKLSAFSGLKGLILKAILKLVFVYVGTFILVALTGLSPPTIALLYQFLSSAF